MERLTLKTFIILTLVLANCGSNPSKTCAELEKLLGCGLSEKKDENFIKECLAMSNKQRDVFFTCMKEEESAYCDLLKVDGEEAKKILVKCGSKVEKEIKNGNIKSF